MMHTYCGIVMVTPQCLLYESQLLPRGSCSILKVVEAQMANELYPSAMSTLEQMLGGDLPAPA